MTPTAISLCSGIEGASVAAPGLRWLAYADPDPFASAVLSHRLPKTPNLGDIAGVDWSVYEGLVDVLIGGTPCQSFSVAGLRRGLEDPRGNVTLAYAKAVLEVRPAVSVWENVPNVLSIKGNPFGALVGAIVGASEALDPPTPGRWPGAGYVSGPEGSAAWRILDAQYFGVPQRRRRLFLVRGSAESGVCPARVLFERAGVVGRPAAGEQAGPGVAGAASGGAAGDGRPGSIGAYGVTNAEGAAGLPYLTASNIGKQANNQAPLVYPIQEVGKRTGKSTSDATYGIGIGDDGAPMYTLQAGAQHAIAYSIYPAHGQGADLEVSEVSVASGVTAVGMSRQTDRGVRVVEPLPFDTTQITSPHNYSRPKPGGPCHPLAARGYVRRLTPIECERLQGFPDDWTLVPYRGGPAADGPRYRAIGNSFAVPVVRWLLDRARNELECAK